MSFIRKALFPLVGIALIILVIVIASPRAVHAVTAALVQIVNTPTNPVPGIHAPAAGQLYQSACYAQSGGYANAVCSLDPVPANHTLFVETVAMAVYAEPGNSPDESYFSASGNFSWPQPGNFWVPVIAQGANIWIGNLAGRVYAPATVQPGCFVYFAKNSTNGNISCQVSGYLAPAQ